MDYGTQYVGNFLHAWKEIDTFLTFGILWALPKAKKKLDIVWSIKKLHFLRFFRPSTVWKLAVASLLIYENK